MGKKKYQGTFIFGCLNRHFESMLDFNLEGRAISLRKFLYLF